VHEPDVAVLGKDCIRLAKKGLPALAITVRGEAGGGGAEGTRILAEHLHTPEVNLLQLVELGRHALEVEHDVVGVGGKGRRLQDDRRAVFDRPGADQNSARLRTDLHALLAPRPLELGQARLVERLE